MEYVQYCTELYYTNAGIKSLFARRCGTDGARLRMDGLGCFSRHGMGSEKETCKGDLWMELDFSLFYDRLSFLIFCLFLWFLGRFHASQLDASDPDS